ncbi:AAA family ATPase [Pinibacter soli]|uniref:AAA family ATPase n=1 Tax=Pinibacter soli TaxID=3044211 RepID=A0ABT6RHD3_9BACT|nr:AAA family ATPase [Pinibacter soli]MDI3321979.1 AAA family ATPase [Pinibacter soli]
MAFQETGKRGEGFRDTLYFNAFTEDLFHWDNDLEKDTERVLQINSESSFFDGFKELALEEKIFTHLERYADFNFKIDYEKWTISFIKDNDSNIKISRGEENIFVWCVFLTVCELAIEGAEAYNWVKYFYIDDPISSLDDNNAIAVASDLSQLLKRGTDKIKTVISSHHSLFFNVMFNELKKSKPICYFLHKNGSDGYNLRTTTDTPFFHHVALLSELRRVSESGTINTYHFNMLRSILERTATFFGFNDFAVCVHGVEDDVLYARALNLLSHGKYSVYEPVEMGEDNKKLFKDILQAFLDKYQFYLPELLIEDTSNIANNDSNRATTIR